jgi:hypothetical protein
MSICHERITVPLKRGNHGPAVANLQAGPRLLDQKTHVREKGGSG